jgi:hypothetical protein
MEPQLTNRMVGKLVATTLAFDLHRVNGFVGTDEQKRGWG